MSNLDVLLITPQSRLEVYQNLSNDYAAVETPVWSMLIAKYLSDLNHNVEILDAEADNLTHEQTAEIISKKKSQACSFCNIWPTTFSFYPMYAWWYKNMQFIK